MVRTMQIPFTDVLKSQRCTRLAFPTEDVGAIPSGVTSCKLSDRACIHLSIHKSIQKAIQHYAYSL